MQTCCEPDQTIIDFWRTDRGASDVNSTGYSEWLYRDELVGVVQRHDAANAATPLLVFYAPHVAHCPLQVPKDYYDKFSFMEDDEGKCAAQTVKGLHSIDPHFPDTEYKCRQQYHAMVMVMDEVVGNITEAFKAKNMWDNTLVVMSSVMSIILVPAQLPACLPVTAAHVIHRWPRHPTAARACLG